MPSNASSRGRLGTQRDGIELLAGNKVAGQRHCHCSSESSPGIEKGLAPLSKELCSFRGAPALWPRALRGQQSLSFCKEHLMRLRSSTYFWLAVPKESTGRLGRCLSSWSPSLFPLSLVSKVSPHWGRTAVSLSCQVFPGCSLLFRRLYRNSSVFAAVSEGPCSSSPSELCIFGFLLPVFCHLSV